MGCLKTAHSVVDLRGNKTVYVALKNALQEQRIKNTLLLFLL